MFTRRAAIVEETTAFQCCRWPPFGSCSDDEPAVCRTAAQLLRQLGHNVQALRSGERALSHLRTHSNGYDLLVLDVMMPHPTGVEVYRVLQNEGIVLPTIFVSGYTEQPLLEGMLDTAGVIFLQKPFRQADVAGAIAQCLTAVGRGGAPPPASNEGALPIVRLDGGRTSTSTRRPTLRDAGRLAIHLC